MHYQKSNLEKQWASKYLFSLAEISAFRQVRREHFVPHHLKNSAYEDIPLPIPRAKTISQPTTTMLMTHWLDLTPGDKVLEVGTGSGYQSALIAKLIDPGILYSIEVLPELVRYAKANLERERIHNAVVLEGDGSRGISQVAPFDRIIITAACREFPKELIDQLAVDGVILGPVGDEKEQEMVRATKNKDGSLSYEFLGQFIFSALYGKYGFGE